ncbi:MAG TPA: amino acid racemase [Ornithinimicrobium sp.]|uniref:aspartate/glutamate racemase family protein n=1 Tax=Ornithinimicrobium sp. TaxID=1977084 RepID=UPI002B45ECD6|nr:amino acid racemase [Ornithinimicrobium sp.]HKJ12795.1 amino acid racemase [Ornithinimicrobium sp.]
MAERHRLSPSRLVGILGGMGPAATVDFYAKLVRHTPAEQDQDHLRVVIWGDPSVPNRQEALLAGGTDPTPWLEEGVRRLIDAGAEIVVVPCNTVHAHVRPVMAGQPVEFIDIIDTTVEAVRRRGLHRVGLLATDGALASGIFQRGLDAAGVEWVLPSPERQASLMRLVHAVKTGRVDTATLTAMADLLAEIDSRGASTAVAGCTEISTLLERPPGGADVVDPALELALRTVERARHT